jgi:hypothetical protein
MKAGPLISESWMPSSDGPIAESATGPPNNGLSGRARDAGRSGGTLDGNDDLFEGLRDVSWKPPVIRTVK